MEHAIASDEAGSDLAACAAYLIETISNLDAKGHATSALVGYFLAKDDVDSAAGFADGLSDPFQRDRLLIDVIRKCIEIKDDEYAFQLADAVEEPGLKASGLESAALGLAARKDYEKALETAGRLDHASDTFGAIGIQQAIDGSMEAARNTVDSIDYMKSRVHARVEIAAVERGNGNVESARLWLADASIESSEIEYPEDGIRTLNEIGNEYLELGDMELAVTCFNKAADGAIKLDSVHKDAFLVASAIGLLRSGDMEAADETLDKVEDKTQVAGCLYGFSRVFETDEVEDAAESIEEALAILKSQTDYDIRSTGERNQMFGAIAVQFQRVGLSQRAIEIAHENEDESERNKALTAIAQLLVMKGETKAGETIINGIEPESERVFACIGISDAAYTVKNNELAVKYLSDAALLSGEVEQHIARAKISDQIALRLNEYGEKEKAIVIARQNLRLVADIRDEGGRAAGLLSLAGVYTATGIEPDDDDKSILRTITRKSDW